MGIELNDFKIFDSKIYVVDKTSDQNKKNTVIERRICGIL